MHVATALSRCGYGVERCTLQSAVVVFGNDKHAHLDHLRFILELRDQRRNIGDDHTRAAFGRLGDLEGLDARGDIDAQFGGFTTSNCFFLAFMMWAASRSVARSGADRS